jgi:hypothetical protein
MPENIQTVHTQSDRSTKETKGRCKQADTDNPNSSKDLLIELITKAQHGNHRSDSSTKADNKHTADKEPIRAGRLSHKTDTNRDDPPKKGKRIIVTKIVNRSRHDHYRTDPGPPQQQVDDHTPPTKPKHAVELLPHPIAQELTAGLNKE